MNKYIINCDGMQSEEEFWEAYVSCVDIEGGELFGRNLDALWDALHAGGPGTPKDRSCFISIRKTDSIKKFRDGHFYDHLRQVAFDLASDPGCEIKFRLN